MEPDLVDDSVEIQKRRGKNLPILCTLSFISIGFGIIGFLLSLMGGKKSEIEMFDDKQDLLSTVPDNASPERIALLKDYFKSVEFENDNFYLQMLLTAILLIVGFLAVLMMYSLKKTGYYLYLLYSSIAIAVAIWTIVGSDSNTGIGGSIFSIFIAILFAIFYGAQLKRMR